MHGKVLFHILRDTFFAVIRVLQPVVDHGPHCQGSGVPAQEGHLAAVEVPQAPLHVVKRSLQVGCLAGHPVQLQIEQGDTWGDNRYRLEAGGVEDSH